LADSEGHEGRPALRIRSFTRADLDPVSELEVRTFSEPWRRESFERLLEVPSVIVRVVDDPAVATAAPGRSTLIGYGIVLVAADQGELANIAVVAAYRGRGVGRLLLNDLLERARAAGVRQLFLEVRVSNEAALRLYASAGFEEVGRRPNYYQAPREDARVLRLTLKQDEGNAS
jgi:ribosomal-protein-alanine N-acetyltransferase